MNNFWQSLKNPFTILAPMEDVTDVVFRQIIAEIAPPDVFFTEFTNVEGLIVYNLQKSWDRLKYTETQRPIVAQIWGKSPEHFKQTARILKDKGFDGIDINMGCPDRSVVKGHGGADLIRNHNLAREIVQATQEGAPGLPISVKTRIGFKEIITTEWLGFLLELKLQAITVHGRTATQLSQVPANWEEIGKVVKLRDTLGVDTRIIGNGDIKDYEEAVVKHQKYGVNGVMIGRGIFTNPWAFSQTPKDKHTQKEYLNILIKHTELFENTWGKNKNFEIMKKFYKIYVRDFPGADALRQKLMACRDFSEVKMVIYS